MRSVTGARSMLVLAARLVGSAGAILALAVALFMLLAPEPGPSPTIPVANTLCALPALMGVLVLGRRTVLSALLLFVASFGSFVWGFGWYFLIALPLPLGLVIVGSLPYFVATVLALAVAIAELTSEALAEPPRHEAGL